MTYKIWHSWLFVAAVSGLRWIGPQETLSATATESWTPAPTDHPEYAPHELFKRLLYPESLCGWQGPNHQGAYCSTGKYCAWVTDISVVGCCASGGSCDEVYTTCIDRRNGPLPTGPSVAGVFTCKSESESQRFCYRNTYPGGYYQYGCGPTSTGEDVVTWWSGVNSQYSLDIVYTGGVLKSNTIQAIDDSTTTSKTRDPSTTSTKSVVTSKTTSTSSVDSEKSSDSSTTATENQTSSGNSAGSSEASTTAANPASESTSPADPPVVPKKGLSMGATVAIGVAVGVVAIVAILLFAFWFYRRRKQSRTQHDILNNAANGGGQSMAQYNLPTMGPSMGTSMKPTELHQDFPEKPREEQHQPVAMAGSPRNARESGYTNSVISSYDPYRQASPQPSVSTATFVPDSPYSTNTAPVTNMSLHGHFAELPTNRISTIPELDSSEVRGR